MASWLRLDDCTIEIEIKTTGCFFQCMQYALNRIRSLNEFCVICDERHVLETGLIKVCMRV